ncbi:MAG TPA: hypothetical protein VIU64_20810 [Polyangia bacterium]
MRRVRLIRSAPRSESARSADVKDKTQDLVSKEIQALLDHARVISPLPRDVRARALARAREVLEAAARSGKASKPAQPSAVHALPSRAGRPRDARSRLARGGA